MRVVDIPPAFCRDENCVIIQQSVCVILEAGDNATKVEEALTDGIRESVESEEFLESVPPENLPC